jgi:imidazolonepropionase-like amidohydrolase
MQTLIRHNILILLVFLLPVARAIAPTPAADQSEPIAIVGAVIHTGNGEVIGDGVITFDEGIITAVGSAADGINTRDHLLIDVQGRHVYPGFVLPNTSLGLLEINSVRATNDVVEEGDINASVRAAIAYNTDSEIIPTNRFNGILTAQITPRGGLISGSSTVMKLDGWNWEDATLAADVGQHLFWPSYRLRRYNSSLGEFETVDNENYEGQTQLLHSLFQDAISYQGRPLNLNLQALQPVLNGSAKLFIHADGAREILSAVRFARGYGIEDIVLVGARDALLVLDFLLAESIPVIYERVHALPNQTWYDVDAPFRTPFLLHEAGLKVGIGGGSTSIDTQRNLPFFAGTAAAYGLDRETALALITRHNAEILGVDNRVGSLEVGKDATLFISEGDALDMRSSKVIGAYIEGRDIDLFGTQQQLYERFREKYENRLE